MVTVFGAPPIDGLGTTGGFKLIIEDRGNNGLETLQRISDQIVERGNKTPGLQGLFNSSRVNTPWLYLDIDRDKCMTLGVPVSELFNTLQVYLGSYYVNNFNEFGRTWQVNVQADQSFRDQVPAILQLQVRNTEGQMIRLATLMEVRNTSGPVMVQRYNMYSSAAITGNADAGHQLGRGDRADAGDRGTGTATFNGVRLDRARIHPARGGRNSHQRFRAGGGIRFPRARGTIRKLEAAIAVILVVPMCLLCSVLAIEWAGLDVSLFTQIGFVVLVGLASKNAILIVEFAKQKEKEHVPLREATLDACRLRLRPILMTSFAFIFGVLPLMLAEGAGAEMRRSLGTAVFSGMLGVTVFGIFLTPVFYYVIQWFAEKDKRPSSHD